MVGSFICPHSFCKLPSFGLALLSLLLTGIGNWNVVLFLFPPGGGGSKLRVTLVNAVSIMFEDGLCLLLLVKEFYRSEPYEPYESCKRLELGWVCYPCESSGLNSSYSIISAGC